MKIVNGRFGQDSNIGKFTCHNPNGNSAVDYVITSPSLFPQISGFYVDVLEPCLSDVHSAIHVSLRVSTSILQCNSADSDIPPTDDSLCRNREFIAVRLKWESELATDYTNVFEDELVNKLHNDLDCVDVNRLLQNDIDKYVDDLCCIYIHPAQKLGIYMKYKDCANKQ